MSDSPAFSNSVVLEIPTFKIEEPHVVVTNPHEVLDSIIDFVDDNAEKELLRCPFCGSEGSLAFTSSPQKDISGLFHSVHLSVILRCKNHFNPTDEFLNMGPIKMTIMSKCSGESSVVSGSLSSLEDAQQFVKLIRESWNRRSS